MRAAREVTDGAATVPLPTKVALVSVVAATLALVVEFLRRSPSDAIDARVAGAFALPLAILFLARVIGQVLVVARRPGWLPPMHHWNLMPYRLLLPTQIAFLVLMAWMTADLLREDGFFADPRPSLGRGLVWLAYVYAAVMAVRLCVRMTRRPEQRWFGGTIPIVFHWVLSAFVFVLGTFHASH